MLKSLHYFGFNNGLQPKNTIILSFIEKCELEKAQSAEAHNFWFQSIHLIYSEMFQISLVGTRAILTRCFTL